MKRDKKIDDIFKDGMAGYSEAPPAFVWDAVESNLQGAKSNKRAIIFWRSLAAAAVIGIVFLAGLLWNNSPADETVAKTTFYNPKEVTQVTKNEDKNDIALINEKKEENASATKQLKNKVLNTHPINSNEQGNVVNNTYPTVYSGAEEVFVNKINHSVNVNSENNVPLLAKLNSNGTVLLPNYSQVDATQVFKYKNRSALNDRAIEYIHTAYKTPLSDADEKNKKALQFALGGQFSPSYSHGESGSSKSSSAIKEDGIMSYTGGINLSIKTRKKWTIETGVYYSQVGQKFSNPLTSRNDRMLYTDAPQVGIASQAPNLQNSLSNISLNDSGEENLFQKVGISNSMVELNNEVDALGAFNAPNEIEAITVQQELDYIEVPFLLRYNLLEKGIGLSVSGGMSTNFLIGNGAYKVENNNKERIGEMTDINNVSYSAIIGFGLRAPVFKSLDFNFEPRLRYFMNTVSDSPGSTYKPYSIGIYTGFSYKF